MEWNLALPAEWKSKVFILLLAGIAAAATYEVQSLPDFTRAGLLPKNRTAPDFLLRDLEGKTHRLAEFRGKAIILNFMATWCGPCAGELPILVRFAREHENDPITIIGIDYDEAARTVGRFVTERGLTYLVLIDDGGAVAAAYGVNGFPTTYFIDSAGRIRFSSVGSFDGAAGDRSFRQIVDVNLGEFIAAARRERRHCAPPRSGAPTTLSREDEMGWELSKVACACGCSAKLQNCDCGENRGGREIREYYARLLRDPDLSKDNARQIVIWKYKDEYVW
jgi:thiol-disulfide isomerase/thioredoxin